MTQYTIPWFVVIRSWIPGIQIWKKSFQSVPETHQSAKTQLAKEVAGMVRHVSYGGLAVKLCCGDSAGGPG